MDYQNITNYIFELGALKKFRHSGFKMAGVIQPDSIAEHAFRAAIIAYFIAKEEGVNDPEKIGFMCLIHDNAEARISDLHKIATRYIDKKDAEMNAFKEQIQKLPEDTQSDFLDYFSQYEEKTTIEGKILRDADLLETAFQAKEYMDLGYTACEGWIDNAEAVLNTETGKKLMKIVRKTKFTDWWKGLKKIER